MSRDSFILLYINILKLFYYLTGMSIAATRFDNRIEYAVSVGVGHAAFKNTALYFQLYGEHSWFNIFCFHFALSAADDALSESSFSLIAAADGTLDYHFALSAAADGPSESFFSSSEQSDRVSVYACAATPPPLGGGWGGVFKHQTTLHPVWDEYVLYYVYQQGWR